MPVWGIWEVCFFLPHAARACCVFPSHFSAFFLFSPSWETRFWVADELEKRPTIFGWLLSPFLPTWNPVSFWKSNCCQRDVFPILLGCLWLQILFLVMPNGWENRSMIWGFDEAIFTAGKPKNISWKCICTCRVVFPSSISFFFLEMFRSYPTVVCGCVWLISWLCVWCKVWLG